MLRAVPTRALETGLLCNQHRKHSPSMFLSACLAVLNQQIALLNQESGYSPSEDEVGRRLVTMPGVWVVLSLVLGKLFPLSHRNVPAKAAQ